MEGIAQGTSPWSWTAEAIGAWAQLATLLVAFIAAVAGFRQIRASRTVSREAEAQESFRGYLRLLIEHEGVDVRATNENRYQYLVVFMLTTFEKIYELSSADENWKETMVSHLVWHDGYE